MLLYGLKCGIQSGNQILRLLNTDRQTNGVGLNALIQQFLGAQLAVSGSRRMDDQALHISHVGQQGEDFQVIDELVGFFLTTLDFKSKVLKIYNAFYSGFLYVTMAFEMLF